MIIHVFPQEKFTTSFIKFINTNFEIKNHTFLIYGKHDSYNRREIENFSNIRYITNKTSFDRYLKQADEVILHSLFLSRWMLLYLIINIKISKKCSWVIWGSDLYSYRIKKIKLKDKLFELIKNVIVKRFKYIVTLSKNDYELAKKWYKVRGRYRKGIYINPINLGYLENIEKNKRNYDNKINIQIGNSADLSNNHIQAIDIIERFKSENITVYCPLSYGDSVYAKGVIDYGKKVLGDKFVGITEYMNPEAYGEFLGKIDIAIFNNNRQQALGNIFALAYLEAKIYMRNDTTMWEDLVEDEGYNFYSIEDIKDYSFEEFISSNIEVIMKNKLLSEKRFDEKYIKNVWEKIFTQQRGD